MKAIVTLTAGLMIVSATFAQSSRRSESKENNESNNRRTESVTERRAPSEKSDNSRTENYSSRRGSDNSVERKSEPNQNSSVQQAPVTPDKPSDRSSVTNRRTPSEQTRESYSNNNSRNSNSGNSNSNNRVAPSQNSVKSYDDNRREPRGDVQREAVIQQHSRRTAEPRHHTVVHKSYRPVPVEVRRVKYPYRAPVRAEVIWTVDLSRRFEVYYPAYRPYHYHYGMRIATISAYDAYGYIGDIARVYGRVVETYYAWETDEYFLYLGDYYPYHDFAVIVPGREARDFSRRPEKFFDRQHIEVTGLVTRFEGKPEMLIKRSSQIEVY